MIRHDYINYIKSELNEISSAKYKDKDLAALYQLGLLQTLLAEEMYNDSNVRTRFKNKVEQLKLRPNRR